MENRAELKASKSPAANESLFLSLLAYNRTRNRALELDGNPDMVRLLKTQYREVVSLSRILSENLISLHEPEDARTSPTAELSLEGGRFDLILGCGLWSGRSQTGSPGTNYLGSLSAFLSLARRSLSEGGKLVLGVENLLSLEALRRGQWRLGRSKTVWGWRRLLRKAGFSHVNIHLAVPSIYDARITCSLARPTLREFYRTAYPRPRGRAGKTVFDLLVAMRIAEYLEGSFFVEAYG